MTVDSVCRQLSIADIETVQSESVDEYDAVVSVCQETCENNLSDAQDHAHFPLADNCENQHRWGGEHTVERFNEAVNEVVRRLFNDQRVLVHCHRGRNRSVAVAIAAYAIWRDTTFTNAKVAVMDSRDGADPTDEMLAFAHYCVGTNLRGYAR